MSSMFFIIYCCATVLFIITVIMRCNSYLYRIYSYDEDKFQYDSKLEFPLWILLVHIISLLIPIFNIIYFIFNIIYLVIKLYEEDIYIHFKENTILGKISKILNKNIF